MVGSVDCSDEDEGVIELLSEFCLENFPDSLLKKLLPSSMEGLALGVTGLASPMNRTDGGRESVNVGCGVGCTGAGAARELDAGTAGAAVTDVEGTGSALQPCPLRNIGEKKGEAQGR